MDQNFLGKIDENSVEKTIDDLNLPMSQPSDEDQLKLKKSGEAFEISQVHKSDYSYKFSETFGYVEQPVKKKKKSKTAQKAKRHIHLESIAIAEEE